MEYSRENIAIFITKRLNKEKERLQSQYLESKALIGYFILDDLLPEQLALKVFKSFPEANETKQKKNLKEYKYVGYQMNKYPSILEEVIYAFQDEQVVNLIKEICELNQVSPDKHLYAGGISMMKKGNFLNPHLDNSHDKDRDKWRVLNLLYYVTPDWKKEHGGNLELWLTGVKNKQLTITSKFNRLVVMTTHQESWHSVSKVTNKEAMRCCVSNYYFSDEPIRSNDRFHVTSFRGRPTQKILDYILKFDNSIRMNVRKVFKKGIRENPHQYKK